MTIGQFEKDLSGNLARLRTELNEQTYFPLPLMKILVAKKNGEPCGLCIPTVRDRVAGSMIMTPFERPKKNHRDLFYPDPLDIGAHLALEKMLKAHVCKSTNDCPADPQPRASCRTDRP